MSYITLLTALLALAVSAQVSDVARPVVDLGYAKYRGIGNASIGVTSYFGIKYAQPPVGELRWAAPKEIEYKNSYDPAVPIDASNTGAICVQGTVC
jgi:carboxylesterase type B